MDLSYGHAWVLAPSVVGCALDSNPKEKQNIVGIALCHYYTCAQLRRLMDMHNVVLNGSYAGISGSPVNPPEWTLDPPNVWTGFIGDVCGVTDVEQTRASNTFTLPQWAGMPFELTGSSDACHRSTAAYRSKISKEIGDRHSYRTANTDDLVGSDTWSDRRYYVMQDANFNVTSICDTSGAVVERYLYEPYGTRTVMNESWTVLSVSAYDWVIGFQGLPLDVATELIVPKGRILHPLLGVFTGRNPWGYIQRRMNLYDFCKANPIRYVEPFSWVNGPNSPPSPTGGLVYRQFAADSFDENACINACKSAYLTLRLPCDGEQSLIGCEVCCEQTVDRNGNPYTAADRRACLPQAYNSQISAYQRPQWEVPVRLAFVALGGLVLAPAGVAVAVISVVLGEYANAIAAGWL